MATGGAGRIYGNSTNAIINTGGGAAIAYHAGVPLKDMEFVQFHPTGLLHHDILMTEGAAAARAATSSTTRASASWRATRPRRWSWRRATSPRAPSSTEIIEGRGIDGEDYVHLDLRHLGAEKIMERLPGIRDIAIHFEGVDPIEEPIPIQPGQHYTMGGIDTDVDGAHQAARLLRRRRVRLRERPRRQPAGRQLAARDDRLRAPRRHGRRGRPRGRGGRRRRRLAPPAAPPSRRWRRAVAELAARGADGADPYAIRAEMIATMNELLRHLPRGGGHAHRPGERCAASRSAAAHRPAQRRRRLQPRPDAHPRARGHGRPRPVRRRGRAGAHRVARLALAHRLLRRATTSTGSCTRWPTTPPEGPRLEHAPVTLGIFEPQERKY